MLLSSKRMRVGIVSGILHPDYGGPVNVVRAHVDGLEKFADILLFGVAGPGEKPAISALFPRSRIFERGFPGRWFRGKGLKRELASAVHGVDVLHAHMLWDHAVYATWQAARNAGKPLIITPHGSLAARWRYSALHKRIYRVLIVDRFLRETSFVHALNSAEEVACREYGITCPIRVIPNGLPASEFERGRSPEQAWERWPRLSGRRVMLYLGRLWEGKGLDILPEAWAKTVAGHRARDWILVLAGPDYRNYQARLSRKIRSLGIENQVLLSGSINGDLKDSLLAAAEIFVLPSHGEGFSVAILEAISNGLPVVYTRECNFPELQACGGGWEVADRQDDLSQVLGMVTEIAPDILKSVGEKGRRLGRDRYTLEQVTADLMAMYRDALAR